MKTLYNTVKQYYYNTPSWIKTALSIIIMISIVILFGTLGAIGLLLLILLMGAYNIYIKRDMFMISMRSIETKMFGKPLDKELWTNEPGKKRKTGKPVALKKR